MSVRRSRSATCKSRPWLLITPGLTEVFLPAAERSRLSAPAARQSCARGPGAAPFHSLSAIGCRVARGRPPFWRAALCLHVAAWATWGVLRDKCTFSCHTAGLQPRSAANPEQLQVARRRAREPPASAGRQPFGAPGGRGLDVHWLAGAARLQRGCGGGGVSGRGGRGPLTVGRGAGERAREPGSCALANSWA